MFDTSSALFKVGDRVRIRPSHPAGSFRKGRVVELRGPLGPKGAQVYRIKFRRKPPGYVEVLEEQLEAVPVGG
jgi:hypothetical protein